MSAAKSGNHIYVSGTGNTLASVAADINDPAFCSWNATTNVFTFNGNTSTRYFRVRAGGTLTISGGEKFEMDATANNKTRLYVDHGGTFIMNDDCILDGQSGNGYTYYWYWYGRVIIMGDGTNNPIIMNYRRVYRYHTTNSNFPNDILRMENCTIGGAFVNNSYFLYLTAVARALEITLKNVTIDDRLGVSHAKDTYFFALTYGGAGYEDNITVENCQGIDSERFFNNTGCYPVYCKNNSWGRTHSTTGMTHYGIPNLDRRLRWRDYATNDGKPYGQIFPFHDGDTWETTANTTAVSVAYGGLCLFRDCTWLRTNGNSLSITYRGRAMLWTGNTFTDANPYSISSNGELSHVFGVAVQVTDEYDNPLEADVKFEQGEGFETFNFITKPDGNLNAVHDLGMCFLTWKHQYSTSAFRTWNDGTGDQVHYVTARKKGYYDKTVTVHLDSDKSLIIKLEKIDRDSAVRTDLEGEM